MPTFKTLDALVRERLRTWPQRPPGLRAPAATANDGRHHWMRGRPADLAGGYEPYLKLPGSSRLRTLPDGLWLNFGGSPSEIFVDIFGIM